jgi:hypothetical protein
MKCEGLNCQGKNEAIGKFHIWYGCKDWGYFNYCQECLEYDKQNGFEVLDNLDEE